VLSLGKTRVELLAGLTLTAVLAIGCARDIEDKPSASVGSAVPAGTSGTPNSGELSFDSTAVAAPAPDKLISRPGIPQGTPRLVDLGKGTCIPCKMMAPILESLGEEYQGRVRISELIDH
jgi:thiol-disulfide isomerase/thioredoxin